MRGADLNNRMTDGPIAPQIVRFAVPLFIGNLFQQLYNTADALIVGNLIGGYILDAVGGRSFYLIAAGLYMISIIVFLLSSMKKKAVAAAA